MGIPLNDCQKLPYSSIGMYNVLSWALYTLDPPRGLGRFIQLAPPALVLQPRSEQGRQVNGVRRGRRKRGLVYSGLAIPTGYSWQGSTLHAEPIVPLK